MKDVAEKIGISPAALQSRLTPKVVRREYATEIVEALKDLTGGDVCIQSNEHGDNHFKTSFDASYYIAKVAELEERVRSLTSLMEEKEKQIGDKERTIKILMERK